MSWFTKYRPAQVSQLHLNSVRERLLELMKAGSFPRAMIFAGPKGTGKTSSARIIGATLNDPGNHSLVDYLFFNQPKPKQTQLKEADINSELVQKIIKGTSFVVHEMDAASNRGIDDIRLLKEKIGLPPQIGKIAVYILDEAHMLTTEAFNALLKILEEPPNHVVFILATTELHKIPETVMSRCTLISFSKATTQEVLVALKQVLESEKIKYDEEALKIIAEKADGSFRDGVKLLESVCQSTKKLSVEDVEKLLPLAASLPITDLINALLSKNEQQIVKIFATLRSQNVNAKYFYSSLLSFLHQQLILSLESQSTNTIANTRVLHYLLQALSDESLLISSPIELLPLELKFLELAFKSKDKKTSPPTTKPPTNVKKNTNHTYSGNAEKLVSDWSLFLSHLAEKNLSLEMLLKSAKPKEVKEGKLIVEVFYPFHRDQLKQPKFFAILQECITPISGGYVELEFVVNQKRSSQLLESDHNLAPVLDEHLVELAKDILV